ncbi:MAG TPA: hypothetical protein VGE74_19675 [Gemmata sp.]
MCTWVSKVRGTTVLRLQGIHCCMSVEDVGAVAPEICRANGWQELGAGAAPGEQEVWVALGDEAVCRLNNLRPAAVLEYRGRTVHFISRERIAATRDYIAARVRRSADFPRHREFLDNLPAEFLKASARDRVVGLLERVLAQAA